jgi:preprotein translocase subunit SecE
LRFAGWIILTCVWLWIFYQTFIGKKLFAFAMEARVELRKVVWPNRQETVQTTMIIAALVIVMSLILWGIDSVLMMAVNWLSGQG